MISAQTGRFRYEQSVTINFFAFVLSTEYIFFNAALLGNYEKELRKLFGALEMSLCAGSNSKICKQM